MPQPQIVNAAWGLIGGSSGGVSSDTVDFSGWTTTAGNAIVVVTTINGILNNVTAKFGNGTSIPSIFTVTPAKPANNGYIFWNATWDAPGGQSSITVSNNGTGVGLVTIFEIANLAANPLDKTQGGLNGEPAGGPAATDSWPDLSINNEVVIGAIGLYSANEFGAWTEPGGSWINQPVRGGHISGGEYWASEVGYQILTNGTSANGLTYGDLTWASGNNGYFLGAGISLKGTVPVIENTSLPVGYVSSYYSQQINATGGTGGNTWSVTGTLPPGVVLVANSGGDSASVHGTPSGTGTYDFTITVTDSVGDSTSQSYSVPIYPAITITTSSLPAAYQNSNYSTTLSVTGGSGTGYTWSMYSGSLPPGMSLNSSSGQITGAPTAAGTYSFDVEVSDSASNETQQSLSIVVDPLVEITTGSLPNGEISVAYTSTTLAATGGSGTGYTWSVTSGSLPAGLSLSSAGVISGTPTTQGTSTFTVQVVDSESHSATKTYSITVTPFIIEVSPTTLPSATINVAYSETLTASTGTSPFTYAVTSGTLPAGISLSSAGVLSGTPTALGTSSFTIEVSDSASHNTSYNYTLAVYEPIAITTSSLPVGVTGVAYSQTLGASGGDGTYSWSVSSGSLPTGLSLSSAGVLSGAPTAADTYDFTVEVKDTAGNSITQALSVAVYTPVVVTTSSLPQGYQTVAYSQTLTASGGSGTGYTWTLDTGALPGGLKLSSAGVISGTPLIQQTASFTVKVTDSVGITATKALTININQALTITTSSLPQAYEDDAYSQTLTCTGGSGTGISWSVSAGTLPTGLSLSSAGLLSGTPSAAGSSSFTVEVTDSASNTATQALTLKVNPQPPVITTTVLSNASIGTYYSQALSADDGTAPYSWSVISGTLPDGLFIYGGVITGSPTVTGTFYPTFEVTDSIGSVGQPVELSITVLPDLQGIPATYGRVAYGEVLYGEVAVPAPKITVQNEFLIDPLVAESLNYESIGIAWAKPLAATDGTASRWRLLKNRYGYPVDQNDGDILIDTPDWLGQFYLDTAVIPNTYHYYGIYAQINPSSTYAADNSGSGNQWVRVGVTGCLAIEQADTVDWLTNHLPAYFTDFLAGQLTQDAAGNQYLQQFLQVLGWGIDYVQGQYDIQFTGQNDPMTIPVDDLVNLAAQMGMPYDPFISIYLMRQAVANWAHVATQRGTPLGIENQVELLTGFDVDLTISDNQLLEDDQSWFPDPAYNAWNDYTSYDEGEIVTWQSGPDTWVYQSVAGGNVGNTPTAGASNSYWTLMQNAVEPSDVLHNDTTGGINTWEVIYADQTNGVGPDGQNSLYEAIGSPAPDAPQLSTNPYFADGATGWVAYDGTLSVVPSPGTNPPYSNSAEFILSAGGGAIEGSGAHWAATAGAEYVVSAWVYTADSNVYLGFDWLNSSAVYITSTVADIPVTANTWTFISTTQTAASGAVYGYARVGNATVNDTLYATAIVATPAVYNANTLGVENQESTAQDLIVRSISRSTTDRNTTTVAPWAPDNLQVINDGIPVPFTLPSQQWTSGVRYGTGDVVTYDGLPYLALRASTNATPGDASYAAEWQQLSTDARLRLMISAETFASGTVPVTPFVEWYDQWGNFIARVFADNASSPGIPANLAFDAFAQNPGAMATGRAHDNAYPNDWTVEAGGFTVSAYLGGSVYQTTTGTASLAWTEGPVNGNVGVTLLTAAKDGEVQGLVFRATSTTSYWEATATELISPTGSTTAYSTAAKPGDRIVVSMNGTAINVYLNGSSTPVASATDSGSYTTVYHGIVVQ